MSNNPGWQDLANVPDTDGSPYLDHYDLQTGAAFLAAKHLSKNWEAAIGDGEGLETLVKDVDEVTHYLNEWRRRVLARFGQSQETTHANAT